MRVRDGRRLRDLLEPNPDAGNVDDLFEALAQTGAVLEGHFALQSGLHSAHFLRLRDFSVRPTMARLAAERLLAFGPKDERPNIICPESAGYLLGRAYFEAVGGEESGASLIVAPVSFERRPLPMIRRGEFNADRPTIIVNDVATTGRSIRPLVELARAQRSDVVAVMHFAVKEPQRVKQHVPPGTRTGWLFSQRWDTHEASPATCPGCRAGQSLVPAIELN